MFLFYFPHEKGAALPSGSAGFQPWIEEHARGSGLLGPPAWTLQTYLNLKEQGLPCELVNEWPSQGIAIAHRDHLPKSWEQRPDFYVVCCLADRPLPHPSANLHILQNPYQFVRFGAYAYMPHWPQPGLHGRLVTRAHLFKKLAFFGEIHNLAPELRSTEFSDWCRTEGLEFSVPNRDAWADYREVDAVLAIRVFTNCWTAFDKPATKLFNAWLAGVIPIVGKESAYASEGRHWDNAVFTSNLPNLKEQLIAIRNDCSLGVSLRASGALAAQRRSRGAIANEWVKLLQERAVPAANRRRKLGLVLTTSADPWTRVKAGLAWRGYLSGHRKPP